MSQAKDNAGVEGIEVRHKARCTVKGWAKCKCTPSYRASAWSARDGRHLKKTWPTLGAAKGWRRQVLVALDQGALAAFSGVTLRDFAEGEWLPGVRAGSIRNRSGQPYKPSTLRGYEQALADRLLPDLGGHRLSDIRRSDVQGIIDRLLGLGLGASTIRNAVNPLRALMRYARTRDKIAVDPTDGLELPMLTGRRERIAAPAEAAALIAATPERDRAIWATAAYAGLRRGELRGLREQDVDLSAGVIRVERSYDGPSRSFGDPKSYAGKRSVPIPAALRAHLAAHLLRIGRRGGLVFGRTAEAPFDPSVLTDRALKVWADGSLEPITLHEFRHTFASLMIAAGVNAKALSTFMGHASITITLDRYGHLFPGSEDEAAGLLDAYLARAPGT